MTKLFHYIIRVPKKESAFVYFMLEASEGFCFYSTLNQDFSLPYRELDLKGSEDYKEQISNLIQNLRNKFEISILTEEVIHDTK